MSSNTLTTISTLESDVQSDATIESLYGGAGVITKDYANNEGILSSNGLTTSNSENQTPNYVQLGPYNQQSANGNILYTDTDDVYSSTPTNNLQGSIINNWETSNIGYGYFAVPNTTGKYGKILYANGNASSAEEISQPIDATPILLGSGTTTLVVNEGVENITANTGFEAYNIIYLEDEELNQYAIKIDTASSGVDSISWTKVDDAQTNIGLVNINPQNVTTSIDLTNVPYTYNTLGSQNNYNSLIHTVSININNLTKLLISILEKNNTIDTNDTDINNWNIIGSSTGISTTGNGAAGKLYTLSSQIYESNTTNTSNAIQTIDTDSGVGYTNNDGTITTNTNSDNTLTLTDNANVNITSNGNDTIHMNNFANLIGTFSGHSSIDTITNGSSIFATLNPTSDLTITGTYSEVYLSTGTANNVADLDDSTAVTVRSLGKADYIGHLTVIGDNGSFSVDNNNQDKVYGVYDNLELNDNNGETVYSETNGTTYINTNNSTNQINVTANGANISLNGNNGTTNLWGENNATLDIYGNANNAINGSWNYVNGIIEANTTINISVNAASLYENGGNITLTGESPGGNLSFNGTGSANIVGRWGSVTATFGQGQDFNAIIGDNSYITINDTANVNIWNSMGSHNAFQQNGGTLHMTMGSGYTGLSVDMNSDSITNISNFTGTNGQIILQNMISGTPLTVTYNTSDNTTSITQTGSKAIITLNGHDNISTIPIMQDGASQAMLIIQ